jgi:hypothetical protein
MALLSAMATLLAALFICAMTEDPAPPGGGTVISLAGTADARYDCPYDRGHCALFEQVSTAVLTVPPPTAPLAADTGPTHLGHAHAGGRMPRSGTHARAPDLHVLQVLRT